MFTRAWGKGKTTLELETGDLEALSLAMLSVQIDQVGRKCTLEQFLAILNGGICITLGYFLLYNFFS